MKQAPRYVRLPHLDDATTTELGQRVIWDLEDENSMLHWAPLLEGRFAILDAFDRLGAITHRFLRGVR